MMKKLLVGFMCSFSLVGLSAFASEADVIAVDVAEQGDGKYRFSVTVLHDDSGWEHYANKWDIVDEKGEILGSRVLHHPHVGEQPFTRSLAGVKIPAEIKSVVVRAHDSVHGYGGKEFVVTLP